MKFQEKKNGQQKVMPLKEWLDVGIADSEVMQEAEQSIRQAQQMAPSLKGVFEGVQSCPEHAEGPRIQDQIEKSMTCLHYILNGGSLLEIEEIREQKALEIDIRIMEHSIHEHAGTLQAATLLQAVGREKAKVIGVKNPSKQTMPFEVAQKENTTLNREQIDLYMKLYRAEEARIGSRPKEAIMKALYDTHGIQLHAESRQNWITNEAKREEYRALFEAYRLTPRDIQHLIFLIKYQYSWNTQEMKDRNKGLRLLMKGAQMLGIDGEDARDIFIAFMTITQVLARKVLQGDRVITPLDQITTFIEAEAVEDSQRRIQKLEKHKNIEQKRVKQRIEQYAGGIEEVLQVLNVPFSQERQVFVGQLYNYLRGESSVLPWQEKWPQDLQNQINKARTDILHNR